MEFDALFVGLAPAGGADGGGFFVEGGAVFVEQDLLCLLYTSPSPRDA